MGQCIFQIARGFNRSVATEEQMLCDGRHSKSGSIRLLIRPHEV